MGDDMETEEPTAGTSRSLMDIDTQPSLLDNDFGGSGFGRKSSFNDTCVSHCINDYLNYYR